MRWLAIAFLFLPCGSPGTLTAATSREPTDTTDPPGRVARLSYAEGAVSFRPAGSDEWIAATLNRPLTTGDMLFTETNAKAELQLGSAFIRLAPQTTIEFLTLSDSLVQVKLTAGTVIVRLRQLDESDDFELDTPVAAVSLLRTGNYRFEVGENIEQLRLTVRSGEAEVSGEGAAFTVHRGDLAVITGTRQLQRTYYPLPARDSFDRFSEDRDKQLDAAALETKQVPAGVIGYEDLAGHGVWHVHAAYGSVWAPTVRIRGWVPYRFGHWIWVEPWGWVWVDDEPWGFAPFHYGRWVYLDWGWSWVPPPPRIRPVWAPALVVFIGGSHPGFAGVAWFPLGPREVYIPPYRGSRTYITNINLRMASRHYANQHIPNAVTAVPRDTFSRGQRVGGSSVPFPERSRTGRVAPPIAPSRESRSGPAPRATPPPDHVSRRPVVERRAEPQRQREQPKQPQGGRRKPS